MKNSRTAKLSPNGVLTARDGPAFPGRHDRDEDRRAPQFLRTLDEWMADESGHDEEMWPKLKAVLEQDRLSSRKLFRELDSKG